MSNFRGPDRRSKKDRRQKPTFPLTSTSLFGARMHFRREEDRQKFRYVDRYSLRSVLTVLFTIVLSIFDATFTLRLVKLGAREINPLMDFFLKFGPAPFLLTKYLLTGICLLWFLVHKNYAILGGCISVKRLLLIILVMYALLILYELSLLILLT
ncbi:MAG: DUF5658 family protein [bacterium]